MNRDPTKFGNKLQQIQSTAWTSSYSSIWVQGYRCPVLSWTTGMKKIKGRVFFFFFEWGAEHIRDRNELPVLYGHWRAGSAFKTCKVSNTWMSLTNLEQALLPAPEPSARFLSSVLVLECAVNMSSLQSLAVTARSSSFSVGICIACEWSWLLRGSLRRLEERAGSALWFLLHQGYQSFACSQLRLAMETLLSGLFSPKAEWAELLDHLLESAIARTIIWAYMPNRISGPIRRHHPWGQASVAVQPASAKRGPRGPYPFCFGNVVLIFQSSGLTEWDPLDPRQRLSGTGRCGRVTGDGCGAFPLDWCYRQLTTFCSR